MSPRCRCQGAIRRQWHRRHPSYAANSYPILRYRAPVAPPASVLPAPRPQSPARWPSQSSFAGRAPPGGPCTFSWSSACCIHCKRRDRSSQVAHLTVQRRSRVIWSLHSELAVCIAGTGAGHRSFRVFCQAEILGKCDFSRGFRAWGPQPGGDRRERPRRLGRFMRAPRRGAAPAARCGCPAAGR